MAYDDPRDPRESAHHNADDQPPKGAVPPSERITVDEVTRALLGDTPAHVWEPLDLDDPPEFVDKSDNAMHSVRHDHHDEPDPPRRVVVRIVPWTWRDGSVHLEVPRVALWDEGADRVVAHLDNDAYRFETACGIKWFGRSSASGIGHAHGIDCQACRDHLTSMGTLVIGVFPHES
jgi:hypothetical protein